MDLRVVNFGITLEITTGNHYRSNKKGDFPF